MDREEERKQLKEEVEELEKQAKSGKPVAVDYERMREIMRQVTKQTLEPLDKEINSSWTRGDKKAYLITFRSLITENTQSSISIIYLFEFIEELRNAILELSREIEGFRGKTKEIENIKARMETILDSPAVQEVNKAIENMKSVAEKKDKNRQQILRDTVV